MQRPLATTLALLVLLPSLLKGAEPLYGLMVHPSETDWVSEVSETSVDPHGHTHRDRSITPVLEATHAPRAPESVGKEMRSPRTADDLLAALTNARDLGPVLAGFDPPAPVDPAWRRQIRQDPADPHRYVAVDGRHGFRRGGHHQTRVDERGRLVLAPGASQGAFVSRAFRVGAGANHLQPGLVGDRGAQVFVRSYRRPGGQPSRWRRVRREKAIRTRTVVAVIQVLVLLLASANQGQPGLGRVTFTPGVYGLPGGRSLGGNLQGGFGRYPQGGYGGSSRGGFQGGFSPSSRGGSFPPRSPSWYPGSNQGRQTAPPYSQAPSLPPSSGGLRIVSRQEWGAAGSNGQPGSHQPRSITIHHTEGSSSSYAGARTLQEVQRFHQNSRGWKDIGYHFLIGPDGTVFEGRPLGMVGSHSPPNSGRVGVCFIGNFKQERPSQAALGASQQLIRALVERGGVQRGALEGHKDQRSTDCPGTHLYPYVGQLRASM